MKENIFQEMSYPLVPKWLYELLVTLQDNIVIQREQSMKKIPGQSKQNHSFVHRGSEKKTLK
jgi:hypothetical protein